MDAANPEQIKQALNFLQGQIIGEGVAAKSLPSVAGSSIAKDLLYGLLRSAHDAELLFQLPLRQWRRKAGQRSVQGAHGQHLGCNVSANP
ncbi:hypothetical protein P4112_19335 [Pseudomonas aeruginosa]|nr:hypothetical protein [Pseudomonas aeruginosa]